MPQGMPIVAHIVMGGVPAALVRRHEVCGLLALGAELPFLAGSKPVELAEGGTFAGRCSLQITMDRYGYLIGRPQSGDE